MIKLQLSKEAPEDKDEVDDDNNVFMVCNKVALENIQNILNHIICSRITTI